MIGMLLGGRVPRRAFLGTSAHNASKRREHGLGGGLPQLILQLLDLAFGVRHVLVVLENLLLELLALLFRR